MSIADFFQSLNLSIKFTDEYFHENYANLFDHFRSKYDATIDDVIEELKNSSIYETNRDMRPEIYEKLIKEDNNIEKLYKIIVPQYTCKRNKAVHINDSFGTVYTGAKQSYIDIPKLQSWVDEYHSYNFDNDIDKILCGFILYLLYIRIHPHFDGNGRISRYLFLENKLLVGHNNYCPLSKVLNDCLFLPVKHMNKIYEWLDGTIDSKTAKVEDYYSLKINVKILRKIYYIIYISMCYKYCVKSDPKFVKLFNKYDDFKYIFCLGTGQHEVGKSTKVSISDGHKDRNHSIAVFINKLLDYEIHVDLIRKFRITD